MKDEKLVYMTSKGKRYHFNPSCTYLKDKKILSIPLEKAKHSLEGPCILCVRSMEKNEENNMQIKDKNGSNSNKNKKEKIKNDNIDNNFNNKFKIINNDESPENNKSEGEMTDDENNNNIKNNIILNNINNNNNNVAFTDNDLSNIMPNNQQIDLFKKDNFIKNKKI